MRLGCIPGLNQTITRLPPKEQAFWVEYGAPAPARHLSLELPCALPDWHRQLVSYQLAANGTSIRDAFLEWYAGKARARHYEACDVVPCGRDVCGA